MEPVLALRSVSKSYGESEVLRDVSLEVPRGAFLALTGRSGSGKSTLFRLLAGLDRPTSGEIVVDGIDMAHASDDELSDLRLRRIGLVFQSFNLLPDLSAHENVRLPMDIAGVARTAANARADELLQIVGLATKGTSMPHVLSGGEQQRVAIARALANRPAIILGDEPTGNLDAANAANVMAILERIHRELGATIVLVTHDPAVLDRIGASFTLAEGRLMARPASARQ